MKKTVFLLLMLFIASVCFAQRVGDRPRFKMYRTENFWNLLKLDTRTGQVWQVQYQMDNVLDSMFLGILPIYKDVDACTVPINYRGIIREDEGFDGRFELYPTKNMYNFILLDTDKGVTYQVQWNTDPNKRFIRQIQ